jgi:adenosylmethionine-8-amino-7-oxononanoate aminotransferase
MHAMQQPAQPATEQQQQPEQPQQQQDGSTAEGEEQQDEESIAAMLQESLLQGTGGTNRAELEAMLIRWGFGQ